MLVFRHANVVYLCLVCINEFCMTFSLLMLVDDARATIWKCNTTEPVS